MLLQPSCKAVVESLRYKSSVVNRHQAYSPGAKYFLFEDLLHPLVRKLFLHLKEATLQLQ